VHPSDDDHGDSRDGTQEVKVERSGDASSHQFGAKNEPATQTLPSSFEGTVSQIRGNRKLTNPASRPPHVPFRILHYR